MKTEDFERLKKLCDENGFEITNMNNSLDGHELGVIAFAQKKKDPWEGVEFVRLSNNRIFKVLSIYNTVVNLIPNGWTTIRDCKPSTEQAYVEQLKKEAFKRFGEIKEGDRFDCSSLGYSQNAFISISDAPEWEYNKKKDELTFEAFPIYKQGKWAERVKERVKVEFYGHLSVGNYDSHLHQFSIGVSRNANQFNPKEVGQFLAEQLEKYLNGEIK